MSEHDVVQGKGGGRAMREMRDCECSWCASVLM